MRRPLDEWIGIVGTEYTTAVREQALYLTADLPYERAADVLRHVGGIGISGRQIQRLLEEESAHIEAALGTRRERVPVSGGGSAASGKDGETAGAERVQKLRQLKTSGRWEEYWARRFRQERQAADMSSRRAGPARRRRAASDARDPSAGRASGRATVSRAGGWPSRRPRRCPATLRSLVIVKQLGSGTG